MAPQTQLGAQTETAAQTRVIAPTQLAGQAAQARVVPASADGLAALAPPAVDDLVRVLHAPLTTLKAFASMLPVLIARCGNEGAHTAHRAVRRGVDRLDHQLALVATDGALLHGALQLRRQPVDLAALASACVVEHGVLLEPHEIVLDASEPAMVNGDAARLREVLTQLMVNAATFTPGRRVIDVHVRERDDTVVVTVGDRGPGLPPDRVEEAFRRGVTFNQPGSGLGLGLPVVRALVQAHGGRVCARPTNPGLCVAVLLPAARGEGRTAT